VRELGVRITAQIGPARSGHTRLSHEQRRAQTYSTCTRNAPINPASRTHDKVDWPRQEGAVVSQFENESLFEVWRHERREASTAKNAARDLALPGVWWPLQNDFGAAW